MFKYELSIAVIDRPESGIKSGDVVSVRPYPRNAGLMSLKLYLILIVESEMTYDQMQTLTCQHFADGTIQLPPVGDPWYFTNPTIESKRRFNIPLDTIKTGWLPDLNISKLQDPDAVYQPFKSIDQIVSRLDGKDGRKELSRTEVDTTSEFIPENAESSKSTQTLVDTSERVAIFFDKYLASFKYAQVRDYGKL